MQQTMTRNIYQWREILRSDGSTKREVTKRIPVLECKRNAEHCGEDEG